MIKVKEARRNKLLANFGVWLFNISNRIRAVMYTVSIFGIIISILQANISNKISTNSRSQVSAFIQLSNMRIHYQAKERDPAGRF